MQRRDFVKNLSIFSLAPLLSKVEFQNISEKFNKKIKPKRLKQGDTIGLIAPGSYITKDELDASVMKIESLGFKTFFLENILERYGYLAGRDERRIGEINTMFSRSDISGIMCVRGGYGCSRILPFIDYDLIKQNPKVVIGFSDITALLYGIYCKTGLIGFHGPVGISSFNDFSLYYFKKVLMEPGKNFVLVNAIPDASSNEIKPEVIRGGNARGELIGGNLSVITSLIGTPYEIDTECKIIFLEETGEEPYRIDRMFTQLIESGKLEKASGLVLGVFDKCEKKELNPSFEYSLSLMEVLYDRLFNLGIPVVYGLSFGHIKNKFTIPIGIDAELDAVANTITLLETAVK